MRRVSDVGREVLLKAAFVGFVRTFILRSVVFHSSEHCQQRSTLDRAIQGSIRGACLVCAWEVVAFNQEVTVELSLRIAWRKMFLELVLCCLV